MKKIFAVIAAALLGVALVLSPMGSGVTALAAGGTITVTPPERTTGDTTTTYSLYKVFVAKGNGTGIAYNTVNVGDEITLNGETVLHSKGWTVPDVKNKMPTGTTYSDTSTLHFILDNTGNVHWGTIIEGATPIRGDTQPSTDDPNTYLTSQITDSDSALTDYAIAAIKTYISEDSPIQTVTTTGTTPVSFTNVDNGYYYVTTTTGTAVSITSANPNANVEDKNVDPTLEKIITNVKEDDQGTVTVGSVSEDGRKAIAENGSTVTYQVTVNFNNGAENVVLHDKLDDGLRLVSANPTFTYFNSNGSSVTIGNDKTPSVRRNENGTTGDSDDPDAGDTLTVDFSNIPSNVATATVTYTAIVESGELTSQAPAKNAAYLTYGTNTPRAQTSKVNTYVYNATYTVTKRDNANQPLAGAGFVLQKTETNGSTTTTYYYKNDSTNGVSWVTVTPTAGETPELAVRSAANAGNITRLTTTSASGGNVITFTGLADGTYELYEVDVPEGYMRAADVQFTIRSATDTATDADGNTIAFTSANLEQDTTVTNRPGSSLPSTGGIGTTIFYVIGGVLVAGAVVLLVMRRKKA